MSKLIVIGIDGMDSDLIGNFIDYMPNFRKVKMKAQRAEMKSVFPPDTTPAWASIYTGLNPASHGILNFVNIADKAGGYKPFEAKDEYLHGKTFWDIAGNHDKKVCIVLPSGIYPGWQVNGIMVCRTDSGNRKLAAFPESILRKYECSSSDLNLVKGFISKKQLPELIEICRKRTLAEADLGIRLLQHEKWDLFFIYFSALDAIQHYFWSYCDENHPDFPGESPYRNVIRDFYVLIDEIIGKFTRLASQDIPLMILSDHGHGARPFKLFNMNEFLRREGMLIADRSKSKSSRASKSKWVKKKLVNFIKSHGTGPFLMKMAKMFPVWKRILAPSSAIDWSRTLAYVTDLSTVKSYSYGGIRVNGAVGSDREDLIDRIIDFISEIREPETSDKLVKWACRREELYEGSYIEKYPDIVLELKHGYGLGWEVNGPLFSVGDFYNIQPGSHKLDSACFFLANMDTGCSCSEMTLMDVTPRILSMLGIEEY